MKSILFAAILATTGVGCYGTGRATFVASTPDLVYVSPGVHVVADYSVPVFYASSYYWRYDGGVWYRSRSYDGGWRVTTDVPVAVRRIDRPATYVHVRADRGRHGGHKGPPPHVRDHRRR